MKIYCDECLGEISENEKLYIWEHNYPVRLLCEDCFLETVRDLSISDLACFTASEVVSVEQILDRFR